MRNALRRSINLHKKQYKRPEGEPQLLKTLDLLVSSGICLAYKRSAAYYIENSKNINLLQKALSTK